MGVYTDFDKEKCLKMFLNGMSFKEISAELDGRPSHQTLYNWSERGEPQSLTGGMDWFTYKQKVDESRLEVSRKRSLQRESEEGKAFIDEAKTMTENAFKKVYERIMEGTADVRGSDLDKMLRLYLLLDNQAAEQVAWMENFATQVFGMAFEIMTEQQFHTFKSKVLDLQYKKRQELEPLVKTPQQLNA